MRAKQAPQALRSLARRLLEHEAVASQRPDEFEATAERACLKLYRHLVRRVGPDGFAALLSRALTLARTEYPFLGAIQVRTDGGMEGIRESVQGRSQNEAAEGIAVVLANIIWLLDMFIGEDLALRLVREAWPGVLPDASTSGTEESIR